MSHYIIYNNVITVTKATLSYFDRRLQEVSTNLSFTHAPTHNPPSLFSVFGNGN